MKITITLKDPDCVYDAINESLEDLKIDGLNDEEIEVVKQKRLEEYTEIANEWFEYGEYLTVEIDTKEKTCVVIPNKK